jgi:hypothetical protein
MKYLIIVFFLLCQLDVLKSQNPNSIIYVLPDSIEIELNAIIAKSQNSDFYFILGHDEASYEIIPCRYGLDSKASIPKWVTITNRHLLVNDKRYPLVFDYDFDFGVVSEDYLGNFPKRDGTIKRMKILSHSNPLKFTVK